MGKENPTALNSGEKEDVDMRTEGEPEMIDTN